MADDEGGDSRILNMRINNKEFLKGTSDSLKAVNTLNSGIDKATKGKGMQTMGGQVDTVKTKFGALQVAGVTALATITNKAVNAGLMLAKGLAIDPITAGFREYEKLLTSTQTIAANTNNRNSAGIAKVGRALDALNDYSDRTIYNFGQMAENAGRFTAAGSNLKDAVSSIKGLANAAALAGASNEQLGSAMYQTSQALGTGVVKLMDWRSLENANLGTKNMRAALLDTAHAMGEQGVAADAAIAKYGSFRDSLREGWLTADVFNKTMMVFAGTQRDGGKYVAYTVKELRKMGYSKEAAIRLNELSAASIESATKIKTFSQLIDVTKEALGSGWAKIFRDLFGDLDEAGKMWTKVGGVVTDVVDAIFGGVDRMLVKWKEMGGFQDLWGGLGNIIQSVGNLLKPFLVLLDAITPGTSTAGSGLYAVTHTFYLFSVVLEKTTSMVSSLSVVFKPLGMAIGWIFGKIKEAIDWFKQFEYAVAPLGPAFERFGAAIKKAFDALFSGDFSGFAKQISAAFGNMWQEGQFVGHNLVAGILDGLGVGSIEAGVKALADRIINYFKGLLGIHSPSTVFQEFGQNIVQGLVNGLSSGEGTIGSSISNMLGGIDKFDVANALSAVISVGVLAAMIKLVYAFTKAMSSVANIGSNFSNMLEEVGNTLESMQTALKAQALKDIAIAIGILAVSLWLLSRLNYEELTKGLVTISALLTGLTLVMKSMAKNEQDTAKGIASVVAMSAAMVLLGTAVLILSAAVFAFGNMPTDVLVKGMASIAVVLAILAGASFLLGKAAPTMILAAGGVLILSFALAALAPVILLFSKLDWSTLFSGMLKMGVALLLLGVAMIPLAAQAPMILVASVALVVLSAALGALLGSLMLYSKVSWKTLMDGVKKVAAVLILLGLAAIIAAPGLILLGVAFTLMGAGLLAAGIGLTLVGAGLAVIAAAGTAAGAVFLTFIESFLALLPLMGVQFIAALDFILKALAEKMPSMVDSIVLIVTEMLRGVQELTPVIVTTGVGILLALLQGLVNVQQKLWDAGIDLIIGFLEHIATKMDDIREAGVEAIRQFIEGLGDDAGQLAATALQAIEDFLLELDKAIDANIEDIRDLGAKIAVSIVEGLNPAAIAASLVKEIAGARDDAEEDSEEDNNSSKPKKKKKRGSNALGTDYWRGGLSLVGERGPELVTMNRGSAVITNKNLVGFMRAVSKLARAMANGSSNAQNSPGGNLVIGVSADFQGDPRRDGMAFAANVASGLSAGLQSQQSGLNQSMSALGSGMSQAFADILGIKSPSTVFKEFAADVAKGFIQGLIANVESVRKASKAMGKAVIEGVAKTITDGQLKLEAIRARSSAYDGLIAYLEKKAEKEDDPKKKEKLQKEIDDLKKKSEAAKKAADNQAALVDAQNAASERLAEFRAADTQGKADMRKEDAAMAAAKASENREAALRLKLEADLVRKYDAKRADIIEGKADIVLKRAKFYSDLANKYSKEAFDYARKVQQEIDAEMAKQLQTVSEIEVKNAQNAFDAYLKAIADAEASAGEDRLPQEVVFNQNNYSPESISAAEAYRNGRSLVSIMERRLVGSS